MKEEELLLRLAVALAIGFVIGLERGWKMRAVAEGERVAGIRTFALIGLAGGVWGALGTVLGDVTIGIALLALSALLIAARRASPAEKNDVGITTDIAALLTFSLGAFAVRLDPTMAAAIGAVTVTLLEIKDRLHRIVASIRDVELRGFITLILISVLVLPLLPNRGFGPGAVLNPYALWWMVVIVAAISFAGYWAVKLIGERRGLLVTGFFAGLASSTALTASLARAARRSEGSVAIFSAGVAMAAGTMFLRLLILLTVINRAIALELALPFTISAIAAYAAAFVIVRREGHGKEEVRFAEMPPLELMPAIVFAALVAIVSLLAHFARERLGEAGVYVLAAIAGFVDVDAISLSMAQATGETLPIATAANAILIAAYVNTLWKSGVAAILGTPRFAFAVTLALLPAILAGAATLALTGAL